MDPVLLGVQLHVEEVLLPRHVGGEEVSVDTLHYVAHNYVLPQLVQKPIGSAVVHQSFLLVHLFVRTMALQVFKYLLQSSVILVGHLNSLFSEVVDQSANLDKT